jgi:hypothetical protein
MTAPSIVCAFLTLISAAFAADWPQWRGPKGDGTSEEAKFPGQWSGTDNIRWKAGLPGKGHSSPIVCKGRIFVAAAIPETEERVLLCLDRKDGKMLWKQTVLKAPMERLHTENSHASSTPACDGERIFCSFSTVTTWWSLRTTSPGNRSGSNAPASSPVFTAFAARPFCTKTPSW